MACARGPLPEPGVLAALVQPTPQDRPAHEQSFVEPFREQVLELHARGVEGQAIWQLLVEQHGFGGSDSSVKRFLRRQARRRPAPASGSRSPRARRRKSTSATPASSSIPSSAGCAAPGSS